MYLQVLRQTEAELGGAKQLDNALEFLRMAARLQLHNLYHKVWGQVRASAGKTLLAELALDAGL